MYSRLAVLQVEGHKVPNGASVLDAFPSNRSLEKESKNRMSKLFNLFRVISYHGGQVTVAAATMVRARKVPKNSETEWTCAVCGFKNEDVSEQCLNCGGATSERRPRPASHDVGDESEVRVVDQRIAKRLPKRTPAPTDRPPLNHLKRQIGERRKLLLSLAVALTGFLLLMVSFYTFPLSGIWGLVVFFVGIVSAIVQLTNSMNDRQTRLVRLAVFLAGILLLVASLYLLPNTTGPPPSGFGAFLVFVAGILFVIFSLVWIHPLRSTASSRMASKIIERNKLPKRNLAGLMSVLCLLGLFAAWITPVRFELKGWYYYDDSSGCTQESQIGSGPYPNPPTQNITGMYYNLFGQPLEGMYRGDYPYHSCG